MSVFRWDTEAIVRSHWYGIVVGVGHIGSLVAYFAGGGTEWLAWAALLAAYYTIHRLARVLDVLRGLEEER